MRQTASGRLVILGGSNSVMRDGWTSRLAMPDGWHVENLSIGGATTLMGLYRLLSSVRLGPGDVVVWEYALNEYNHWSKGIPLAVLREQLQWLLVLCRNAGAGVVPIIMYAQPQHEAGGQDEYVAALRDLLAEAGLSPVCCRELLIRGGGPSDPPALYQDPAHYAVGHPLLGAVAADVARRAVSGPAVPALDPPALRGREIWLADRFPGLASSQFATSRISCREYLLRRPYSLTQVGRLLGVIVIASPDGAGLTLVSGKGQVCGPFATAITEGLPGPARQIKHINVQAASDDGLGLALAGRLNLRPWHGMIVQPTFDLTQGPRRDALVALVMASPTRTAPQAQPLSRLRRITRRMVDRLRHRP